MCQSLVDVDNYELHEIQPKCLKIVKLENTEENLLVSLEIVYLYTWQIKIFE